MHGAVPEHAHAILERSRWKQVSRGVFRGLSERLAPWRLVENHGAWRRDHLWSKRRDTESWRCAHWYGGDLSSGGAAAGGNRKRRRGAGNHEWWRGGGGRAHRTLRSIGRGRHADARAHQPDSRSDSRQHQSSSRAQEGDGRGGHPADDQWQDYRAGRPRGYSWPTGAQPGRVGESGGAGFVQGFEGAEYVGPSAGWLA